MKDLNNVVKVYDGNMEAFMNALNEGKTVEVALEKGPKMTKTLETGFSEYMNAHFEVIKEGENLGTCGCGKPADTICLAWRD